jgi:hypothetical protein
MFGTIKVLAGDFTKTDRHQYSNGLLLMESGNNTFGLIDRREKISIYKLSELEVASEETVKKIAGTVGWGIAGGVILGPAGLLAGLLLGGKKKEVTFVAKFNDNRKMLATTDSKTFSQLQAAHWEQKNPTKK